MPLVSVLAHMEFEGVNIDEETLKWMSEALKKDSDKVQKEIFEIAGTDNRELAKWINDNLSFDQLILEFYTSAGGMASGWVHCSYKPSGNRKQFLTAIKKNGKTQYLPATTTRLEGL